jgi:hypothetical protein
MSAVHNERSAHLGYLGGVSADQRTLEPVSGFEPLTVRLQGGCSARLSYTGRLAPGGYHRNPCQGTGFRWCGGSGFSSPRRHGCRASRR